LNTPFEPKALSGKIGQMAMTLRDLPGVDKVLSDKRIIGLAAKYPHELIVSIIRQQLESERNTINAGKTNNSLEGIILAVEERVAALFAPSLRRVINASGVILHTNLGRAPISSEALAAMDEASRGYSNLEFDLETGNRGSRHVHIENLLCRLTGAEAGMVVNNNAAAVLLGLSALAKHKEVIVSRGQAVEIGGGFRIPDVMRQSGAKLVEVGTTNRTYARDFEEAVTEKTSAVMRIHSSNFKLVGFTSEVALEELSAVAKKHHILLMDDLGSGCFIDTTAYGLSPEPMVQQSVKAGALTFFSGDKLVGGPQAGIIIGEKQYIEKLKRHPLARVLRVDKTRLAGLAVTLMHYLKGEALEKIPVWRMIAMPVADIEKRAKLWIKESGIEAKVVSGETMVGGGSLPGGTLPTKLVAVGGGNKVVQSLAKKLRSRDIPVIGRIEKDQLLLDPRTVLPEEDEIIVKALRELVG
jgi:L-seryl-tRNA(Ser) seleniumtransferase